MSDPFHINVPTAVHFGGGVAQAVASYVPKDVGAVLLVRGRSEATSRPVRERLETQGIEVHQVSVSAEPSVASVNAALNEINGATCGAIIACGGGSVLDTAKALRFCLERGAELPLEIESIDQASLETAAEITLVAIPTTAGTGAEVTGNAVLGRVGAKTSLRGRRLFPTVALVDPALFASAPTIVAVGAGLDALTQTIEAYTSRFATPFTDALTEPNIRLGAQALRKVAERGDEQAWTQMGWLSLSSGLALANGGLGAAHGLAAVLGGRFGAPHGLVCGRLLGPVLGKNRTVADIGSEAFRKIEHCIDVLTEVFPSGHDRDELSGLGAWLAQYQVPRLRDYCPDRRDFDQISEAAVFASSSTKNAVPLKKADFREILDAAY